VASHLAAQTPEPRALRLADPRPVHILRADPSLGESLDPRRFAEAQERLVTASALLEPSTRDAAWVADSHQPDDTLLVVAGLMLRRVVIGGRPRSELLGPGDIVRPWESETRGLPAEASVRWRVATPTRLAFLDEQLFVAAGAWPEVLQALVARAARRAQSLAVVLSLSSVPRVEERLSLLFWHLANRFGKVTPEGVRLSLPLTHELLAELAGAQRPTVTSALAQLADSRTVVRDPDGDWVLGALRGQGPEAAVRLAPFAT
jgi:CRP-like cAMP-binding protein